MSEPAPIEDVRRLITLVDAIVAIAITILVLPLAELAGEIGGDRSVRAVLGDHLSQFGAVALSFVVIADLWLAQHRVVRYATTMAPPVVFWLFAWTATIVFLPFPTALLAATGEQDTTKILYLGTLLISSGALTALSFAIRRDRGPADRWPSTLPTATTTVSFGLALLLSLFVPAAHYYPLLILIPDNRIASWLARRTGHDDISFRPPGFGPRGISRWLRRRR